MPVKVRSNAKLNLGLRLTGRRPDGYHLLHTLFQEIDFCDELQFTSRADRQIKLAIAGPGADAIVAINTLRGMKITRLHSSSGLR